MKLKIYLVMNKLSITEFSKLIGYSRNQISGVANETNRPSKRLATEIERATKGQVTVKDLLHTQEQ